MSENNFLKNNVLVFCNISICILFEYIMLESKNVNSNYINSINRLCEIIGKIEENYLFEDNSNDEREQLINLIDKTMRKEDHKI